MLLSCAAQAQQATEYPSAPSPAFTAGELTALPTTQWPTNGRNTMLPLGGVMPQAEIQHVAAYLVNELLPTNAP